jgi:cell division protein FtsW
LALTFSGFIIFLSASLGLLVQDGASFGLVALKQTISLALGLIAFFIFSKLPYVWIRRSAFFILIGAIVINLLLFIPSLAVHHGGASRWIDIGFVTFQPSEFLKIAFIIYMSAWLYFARNKLEKFQFSLLPYIIVMAVLGVLLLAQSDTDTLVVIGFTGIVMLLIAGAKIKHIAFAVLMMLILIIGVVYYRPYAFERVKTFFNKGADAQGAGYQINQSLIAIGSGQITGRGFGQSVQKFGYLPQPTDDSVFAVAAEEFGFIGSSLLIFLYCFLLVNLFRISTKSPDLFGSLMAIGLAVLVGSESFMNISAMLGIIPLSGMPLLFVSHGGTALIIILAVSGIVANISKYSK